VPWGNSRIPGMVRSSPTVLEFGQLRFVETPPATRASSPWSNWGMLMMRRGAPHVLRRSHLLRRTQPPDQVRCGRAWPAPPPRAASISCSSGSVFVARRAGVSFIPFLFERPRDPPRERGVFPPSAWLARPPWPAPVLRPTSRLLDAPCQTSWRRGAR